MKFKYNDGGRQDSGFKGNAGDCVARSIAIASNLPYIEIYKLLSEGNASQRRSKSRKKPIKSARNGIDVRKKWFKSVMNDLGFTWHPSMFIGSGCKVHLVEGELPNGRLVVSLSKHYTAVINGVIHDTYNPQRETHITRPDDGSELKPGEWVNPNNGLVCKISHRCVYGYWKLTDVID